VLVARRALPAALVVLVAVLGGCSGAGQTTRLVTPAATAASSAGTTSPGTTTAPGATPATVPPGAKAAVDLAVALRSTAGDANVVVDVRASGYAPRGRDDAAALAAVRDLRVDYGDGVQAAVGGTGVGGAFCGKKTRLGVLALEQSVEHVYARPGTYTLTVAVSTCRPDSAAARTTSRDLRVVVTRPPAGARGVTLDVRRASPDGERQIVLGATASGSAPRGRGATGSSGAAVMGVEVDFGDGTKDDGPAAAAGCAPDASAAPLRFTDERRHTYAKAGTWTVSYTLLTCAPGAATTTPTTRTLEVTVR
jgi:hypothetical protein